MERRKVDGCSETPEHVFPLALNPDMAEAQMATTERKLCLGQATAP